jgi:hypothetical protein
MSSCDRRSFLLKVIAGTSALAVASVVQAEDAKKPLLKLAETDAYARSMGFKVDTNLVDKARYPRHSPDQQCNRCQLFKADPSEPEGPCSFFGNRIVPATGWCRNFKARTA